MNDEPDISPNSSDEPAPAAARQLPPWLVPLLIGLVTITAGVFAWRAGQLASSAAYEDRQSIGQTIKQEQQKVEAGLATVSQTVAYVDYVADFAEAAALDSLATEMASQGLADAAATTEDRATTVRDAATLQARVGGVFGEQSVLTQRASDPTAPIPFDISDQLRANQAAVSTGITSPGVLDPDAWATAANETRERVRGLRLNTLLLLIAVLAYTVAELAPHRRSRQVGFAVGSLVYLFVTVTSFSTVF